MRRRPTVLALDLGSTVGWAFGDTAADGWPRFGTWVLPEEGGRGARFAAFQAELEDNLAVFQPDLVVREASLPIAAMNGEQAARQQIGLDSHVESSCALFNIETQAIGRDDVLTEILGQCRFTEKGEGKRRLLRWCQRQGMDVTDANASDAIGVWEHRRRLVRRMWAS